ncbi:GolD/DthD family dehydrogenase [Rubellimicrobium arenae]|uniref:GolD/DthD family dehydrogenase n=1 Tax=Rubellimicrobium arenae TaxID=2817372 RepID=UPI001B30B1C6|nr:D-threitol dehydrogenase [Rubellimicrobium arenae]
MASNGALAGRVALVTGAAGGIGGAIARRFAGAGARLALVDRDGTGDLAADLGPGHMPVRVDLSDPDAIAAAVTGVGERLGGIDILVNNAGLGHVAPAEEVRLEDWDRVMAVNLRAPWLMARAAFPFLRVSGRGRVINMASQAGVIGLQDHALYGASKAGLIGLNMVLAVEWGRFGITSNCISPTVVETPLAIAGWSGEKGERARAEIPVGRFARPDEIAAAALYLAGDDAAMVNGANLRVDGGYTIR